MAVAQSTTLNGLLNNDIGETGTTTEYLLRPAKPTQVEFKLNLIDHLMPAIYTPFCFIYDCRNESEHVSVYRPRVIQRLKASLESLLEGDEHGQGNLPELLGKIFEDPKTGGLTMKIEHDSAIRFLVSIRDDISLPEIGEYHYPQHFLQPEVFGPGSKNTNVLNSEQGTDAFWFQLTFVGGGIVFMINKHHALLDGGSFTQLVRIWFQRARNLGSDPMARASTISCREKMFSVKDPVPELSHPELMPSQNGTMQNPVVHVDRQIFHLTAEKLKNLTESVKAYTSVRLSTNDVLSALLWRCITRARHHDFDATEQMKASRLIYAVGIRHLIIPKRTAFSLDNAAYPVIADIAVGTLINKDLSSLATIAAAIRAAVEGLTIEHLQSAFQLLAPKLPWRPLRLKTHLTRGSDLHITSLAGLYNSVESLEIGCGKFQCIRPPDREGHDGTVVILPTYGRRDLKCESGYAGGIEVYVELEERHLDHLRADADWLQFATFGAYGGW